MLAMAAALLAFALATLLVAWVAINAAVVVAFRAAPLEGLAAVIAVNSVAALVSVLQVRRLLRRPVFTLTKQEAGRDVRAVLAAFE